MTTKSSEPGIKCIDTLQGLRDAWLKQGETIMELRKALELAWQELRRTNGMWATDKPIWPNAYARNRPLSQLQPDMTAKAGTYFCIDHDDVIAEIDRILANSQDL